MCDFKETDRVLDVGCGVGTFLLLIPGKKTSYDPIAHEYEKLFTFPSDITLITIEALPFNRQRDPSHPHSFTKAQAKELVQDYDVLFESERSWPMRAEEGHVDYVLVLKKK